METLDKIDEIYSVLSGFKKFDTVTAEEAREFYEKEIHAFKTQCDMDEIISPPCLKRAIGLTGSFEDFVLKAYSKTTLSEYKKRIGDDWVD